MTAKFFAILTNQGAAALANATALGTRVDLTHIAVGDGGGVLPTPDPAQTALKGEKRRAAINMLTIDPGNDSQIIAEQIIPENEGGWWIREIGLFSADGTLIAVANCPETYKPQLQEGSGRTQTIRMVLIVSSAEAVTLKIDPAVVLATRQYVDEQIGQHAKSRNHPDATLTEKGFVQLSSATDSSSETRAATPKAVKAASDAALKITNNLSDLKNKSDARGALELGTAATKNVGVAGGNVMAVGAFGLGVGPIAKDDAYSNVAQFYRVNASSVNKPPITGNIAAGVVSLPCDASPSTGYVAVSGNGGAYIGSSNAPANGVKWSRAYTTDFKPTADDVGALSSKDFPAGIPQPWPLSTAPTGWLKCNGAAFDKAQYPLLAQAYSNGRLPDLRGEFLRGWDDGRGVDNGRAVMTAQAATWIQPNIENNPTTTSIMLGNGEGEFNSGVLGAVTNLPDTGNNGPRNKWYIRPRNIAFNYIVRAA
ncbi:Phage tail fiber repeat protein [Serratia proteamaculans]|uniref:phage tail-collar fiber domain-containing protein n=1 Tax=Serratia proteamaculans TaxID=28151 RepID=UPI0009F7C426|nr:phage tail protein [Serratia proteamaculans]SMB57396.1 Phage tail fiber repeat protein [Serratia proteamaculans]